MANNPDERLKAANELLVVIASCGRRFFYSSRFDRTATMERDERGRIWFHDEYTGKRIHTHYRGEWRGFTNGGTLQALVIALRDFIVCGRTVNARQFGPWSDWLCGGDLWGYGADMEQVRSAARRLGIVAETPTVGAEAEVSHV